MSSNKFKVYAAEAVLVANPWVHRMSQKVPTRCNASHDYAPGWIQLKP